MGKIKLAIGLPISDTMLHTPFFLSFIMMEKPDNCQLVFPQTQFHSSNLGVIRNHLCSQAIALGCTHILMMDTDQVYHDQDLIERLFSHGKPIVGGKVHRRYPPFEPILNVGREHVSDEEIDKGGLIKVDATGTGCILIDLSVLETIPRPWFEISQNDDGTTVGEDIGFCYKVAEYGYEVFVDCDVKIGHLATVQVDDTLYRLWKNQNMVKK